MHLAHVQPHMHSQVCMRFASYDDLDRHECTVEEREEYEQYIERGLVIYAGGYCGVEQGGGGTKAIYV